MASPPARTSPATVLILTAATGGGHHAAAEAISRAVEERFPGRYGTAVCDPLTGSEAHSLLRRVCGWYGPLIRRMPWAWWAAFHAGDTAVTRWVLRRWVTRRAVAPIVAALIRYRPVVVVAVHPLAVDAAVAARDRLAEEAGVHGSVGAPALVTVVTDLATAHGVWWHRRVDRTITPSSRLLEAGRRAAAAGMHGVPLGIPVRGPFREGPCAPVQRAALRNRLGLRPDGFLVLLTAGAEGGRGLHGWTRAIVERVDGVDVVAVCGRNDALRATLGDLAASVRGDRLRVMGSVPNMSDWIRCADVVISKAGPSIIAEASSAGVPLLLPGHLPGQESGNTELTVATGAARRVRGRRDLARQVDALRSDPAGIAAMRAAAIRAARPDAATRIAEVVAAEAARSEGTARIRSTTQRKETSWV